MKVYVNRTRSYTNPNEMYRESFSSYYKINFLMYVEYIRRCAVGDFVRENVSRGEPAGKLATSPPPAQTANYDPRRPPNFDEWTRYNMISVI